jgi:hypothetical protein
MATSRKKRRRALNSGALISLVSTVSAWVLYALNVHRATSALQSAIFMIVAVALTIVFGSVGIAWLLAEIANVRDRWEAGRLLLEKTESHADAVKSYELIHRRDPPDQARQED